MRGSNIASNSEKLSCKCDVLDWIQYGRGMHMTEEAHPKSRRLFRNHARISAIVIFTLLLYTSYIVVGRYRENQQADAKSLEVRAKFRGGVVALHSCLASTGFPAILCAIFDAARSGTV